MLFVKTLREVFFVSALMGLKGISVRISTSVLPTGLIVISMQTAVMQIRLSTEFNRWASLGPEDFKVLSRPGTKLGFCSHNRVFFFQTSEQPIQDGGFNCSCQNGFHGNGKVCVVGQFRVFNRN